MKQKGFGIWMRDRKIIDLHSHVLPGIDDGSQSVEMSPRHAAP